MEHHKSLRSKILSLLLVLIGRTGFRNDASVQKEDPKPAAPVQTKEKEYVKSEVYYGVQIMGLGRLLKSGDPAFKGLNVHHVKGESSNIYRYIYGKYDTIDKAKEALPLVRKKFPEAFPVQVIGTEVKRVK